MYGQTSKATHSLLTNSNEAGEANRNIPVNLTDFNSNIYANVVDPRYYCDSSEFDDTTTSGMYRARPASANLEISHGRICISGSYNQFSISGRFNQFTGGAAHSAPEISYLSSAGDVSKRDYQSANETTGYSGANYQFTSNQPSKHQQPEFGYAARSCRNSVLQPNQEISLVHAAASASRPLAEPSIERSLEHTAGQTGRSLVGRDVLVVGNPAQTLTTYNHLGII